MASPMNILVQLVLLYVLIASVTDARPHRHSSKHHHHRHSRHQQPSSSTTSSSPLTSSDGASSTTTTTTTTTTAAPSSSTTSSPPQHTPKDAARIAAFQQNILGRMGLKQAPQFGAGAGEHPINSTLEDKRAMLRMYRRSVEELKGHIHNLYEEEDTNLLPKEYHSIEANGEVSAEGLRVYVPVELEQPGDANQELSVESASLHLFRRKDSKLANLVDTRTIYPQIRVDVYQLLESPEDYERPIRRLVDSKLVPVASGKPGWEDFDIKEAVADWIANPMSNFGLEIVSSNTQEKLTDVLTFSLSSSSDSMEHGDEEDTVPRASIYTIHRAIVGRTRRHAPETYDCQQGDGEQRCCRYPIWISFKDIGWDKWVVQPDGYQAYFCDGGCPHTYKVAHNFASIKSLINLANPAAAPAPCCTASKLSPLALLHYNEHGQLVVTIYEDMIVEQCKCA